MTLVTRKLINSVTSEKQPHAGQRNRSSANFSTEGIPNGTKKLVWEIEGDIETKAIKFNVMQDKSVAIDPTIFTDVFSGKETDVKSARFLYIANPKGATSSFKVNVYAVY